MQNNVHQNSQSLIETIQNSNSMEAGNNLASQVLDKETQLGLSVGNLINSGVLNPLQVSVLEMLADQEEQSFFKYRDILNDPNATPEQKTVAFNAAMNHPSADDLLARANEIITVTKSTTHKYHASATDVLNPISEASYNLLSQEHTVRFAGNEFAGLLKGIKNFILNPAISTQFFNENDCSYNEFVQSMDKLQDYFRAMTDNQAEAILYEFGINQYPEDFSYENIDFVKTKYQLLTSIPQN